VTPMSPAGIAGTILLVAWGLAFSMACHLSPTSTATTEDPGITALMLGESRQALSLNFFNEADLYFHKGVGHIQPRVVTHSLFQSWQDTLTPEQHAHAEGVASAEILPWLKLAIRADPRNVDAFLVAAFWAETGLLRDDLASEILNEAQRANPDDYRIPLEKGRMFIRTGRFDKACDALRAALQFQSHAPVPQTKDLQVTLDRAEILTFLGFLYEIKGQRPDAIHCFNNALAIFPQRTYIKERVTILEAGQEPPDTARVLLEKLTRQTVHDACHDEPDHVDHHGE